MKTAAAAAKAAAASTSAVEVKVEPVDAVKERRSGRQVTPTPAAIAAAAQAPTRPSSARTQTAAAAAAASPASLLKGAKSKAAPQNKKAAEDKKPDGQVQATVVQSAVKAGAKLTPKMKTRSTK